MIQPQSRPGERPAQPMPGPRETIRKPRVTSDLPARAEAPLLPATARLLTLLLKAEAPDRLAIPADDGPLRRLAGYCARPEESGPFQRFHVEKADEAILRLVRRDAPGFEVLQSHRDKFKYHWRGDLVRAFEEEVPILSRYWVFAGDRAVAVEHLVAPLILRHRVRELHGWFTFGEDLSEGSDPPGELAIVRRPLRSRIVRLHDRPPARGSVLEGGPGRSRGRWRRHGLPPGRPA